MKATFKYNSELKFYKDFKIIRRKSLARLHLNLHTHTHKNNKKITVIFKFRKLRTISAFFSVVLVHMSVIYVDNIGHFGLSVCFLTDKKVRHVLVCSSIFY